MSSRHPRLAATATTNNANQKSGPAVASNIRAARLACRSAVMSIESGTSRGAVKLGNSASLVRQDFGVTQQMYWLPCQTSTVAPFVSRERRAQSSAVCKSGNRRSEFGADKVQPLSSQRSKTRLGTACERSDRSSAGTSSIAVNLRAAPPWLHGRRRHRRRSRTGRNARHLCG